MSHPRAPKVDPAAVLERFTAMNRGFSSEVVITRDGRVGVRTFVDPAEDPAFQRMSWDSVAAEWPVQLL